MLRKSNRKKTPIKVRLHNAGAACVRVARKVVPLAFLAAVAVAVPFGMFQGYLYVVSTPYFALVDVEVTGLQLLERDEVLERAGVVRGTNMFDLDVHQIQERLEQQPWIRHAVVEKRLPSALHIEIEERSATAILIDGASYVIVDGDGEPFKTLEPQDQVDELLALPLITGLTAAEARGEHGGQLLIEAMEVVRLAREAGLPKLSEVHVDPVMGLSIVPAQTGIEIRLGRGMYAERVERLRSVLAAIEREGRSVDYILIDQEEALNRVTVGSRSLARAIENAKHD